MSTTSTPPKGIFLPDGAPLSDDAVHLAWTAERQPWVNATVYLHVQHSRPGGPVIFSHSNMHPVHPNEPDICTIFDLPESDVARLGVLLTLLVDAELCMAAREEIMRGPEGPHILARAMRRTSEKAAAKASVESPPPALCEPIASDEPETKTFSMNPMVISTKIGR